MVQLACLLEVGQVVQLGDLVEVDRLVDLKNCKFSSNAIVLT